MSMKKIALLGMGVLLALVVAAISLVIQNQTRNPALSVAVGVPPQDFARASLARKLFSVRLARDPKAMPGASERRLAEQAFAVEPLAVVGMPVLIQALAADGKVRQSEQLLAFAGQLTRRDTLLNALQIEDELKRNRPERLVRLFGRAMAVNNEVRTFYMDRMAAATAQPNAIKGLAPILGERPSWERAYWDAVLKHDELLPQVALLRRRIAEAPWNRTDAGDVERDIIARLAIGRNPEQAFDLAHALALRAPSGGNILLDGDFEQKPQFVPFDWEAVQSGELGANIDRRNGTLVVTGLAAADGVVARQLVALESPGRYRLTWKLSGLSQAPASILRVRLSCAEAKGYGATAAAIILSDGAASKDFELPASDCSWYWTAIELDTTQSDAGVDVTFDHIALRRVSGQVARAIATSPPAP